jgi:uncharacterized protein (DUF433 family)
METVEYSYRLRNQIDKALAEFVVSRFKECSEQRHSRHRRGKTMMDYQNYIIRDPKICGGEPVIKGTRVTLRTILASLAEGASFDELLEDFPSLKEQDVRAAIAFAAASAAEDLPLKSLPGAP